MQNEDFFWKKEIPLSMSTSFVFKQFELEQGKAAFKLGTDSVLLGSWLPKGDYKRVLDIGAGTGILSLMLAQRFKEAVVLALEIDKLSVEDCANNFSQSTWGKRLNIIEQDAIEWSKYNEDEKFDLMISNPPYFKNSLLNPDERKSTARHSGLLNTSTLADFAKRHLSINGCLAIILPVLEFDEMTDQLRDRKLFLQHICLVSSFQDSEIIRKMGVFSFTNQTPLEETHYLYNSDKSRSNWYQGISDDFYIK